MKQHTLLRFASAATLLLATWGCADEVAAPTSPPAMPAQHSAAAPQEEDVQTLARGMAQALADPKLRGRLLEDLRDSPFPQHKIHLKSYLKGVDGDVLLDASAKEIKKPKQQLRALLDDLPEMELMVPRPQDRVRWNGSEELVIFGTARDPARVLATEGALRGYTPAGDSVVLRLGEVPAYTVLALSPAEVDFGSDPEARRKATPRRARSTISTREVEFSLDPAAQDPECTAAACTQITPAFGLTSYSAGITSDECPQSSSPDATTTSTCEPPPTEDPPPSDNGPYPYAGRDLGVSFAYCTSPAGDDTDSDGVRDSCEEKFAQKFAPVLKITTTDRCPNREPYWSVAKWDQQANSLKVMYLISYYRDCPRSTSTGHAGDSEWIVLTAVASTEYPTWWYTYSVTTSAHYGAPFVDDTKTTRFDAYPEWYMGFYRAKPVVWVALDKHANYTTASECNGADFFFGYGYDACGTSYEENVGVPSHTQANIGTVWAPSGGRQLKNKVYSRASVSGYAEYMWGYDPATGYGASFCGWQTQRSDCAGKYGVYLLDYSF